MIVDDPKRISPIPANKDALPLGCIFFWRKSGDSQRATPTSAKAKPTKNTTDMFG